MARDRLGLDYSENMSDATTCSCMVSSVEKCSVRSCGSMFQEPFFLHPPGSRPRDGLYINPMSATFAGPRSKDTSVGGTSNGSESFYLHSPHELVYTRITHLFDDGSPSLPVTATSDCRSSVTSSSRASVERKDEPLTVKVDVHINGVSNSSSSTNGYAKPMINGASVPSSPHSERGAKDSGSEHAYEQICVRPGDEDKPPSPKYSVLGAHKKLSIATTGATDNASDGSSRSHKADRRYSRSSSASESSNMSSEVHYSSATSTPSLSRNSSNERMSKSPKVPEIPPERKNSTTSSTRVESEKETKTAISGPSIFRPPPPPPPPPPEIEEVVIVTSKVVESTVKEEKKDGTQSTMQEQKCESTITTISAANKDYTGSEAAGTTAAAAATTTTTTTTLRGGESPDRAVPSGQPATSIDRDSEPSCGPAAAGCSFANGAQSTTTTTTSSCQVTAHLVNRHMVLPFIPPKFTGQSADSDTLLKPSEYLRSICKAAAGPGNTSSLSKARSVDNLDIQGRGSCEAEEEEEDPSSARKSAEPESSSSSAEDQERGFGSGPPPPPLPPPPVNGIGASGLLTVSSTATLAETRQAQQIQQPLATISIQDLTSVQLRRTNVKMHATKTFSAPPNRSVSMTNVSEAFFVQKTDLIAELKKTKDIPGIKKLKVERAQNEKSQEQNLISEITKSFSASNFVDQIPEKDSSGNVIPIWKRQMLARKAAERAKKEMEERIAKENEEKRIQAIPPWKRQLLARKDSEVKNVGSSPIQSPHVSTTVSAPKIEVATFPKKEPIVEISSTPVAAVAAPTTSSKTNVEDNKCTQQDEQKNETNNDDDTDNVHIIPWRAQLRKTNSKLNILD